MRAVGSVIEREAMRVGRRKSTGVLDEGVDERNAPPSLRFGDHVDVLRKASELGRVALLPGPPAGGSVEMSMREWVSRQNGASAPAVRVHVAVVCVGEMKREFEQSATDGEGTAKGQRTNS